MVKTVRRPTAEHGSLALAIRTSCPARDDRMVRSMEGRFPFPMWPSAESLPSWGSAEVFSFDIAASSECLIMM